MLEGCLAAESKFILWIRQINWLFQFFWKRAILLFCVEGDPTSRKTISREAVNQQEQRMLNEYGNSMLRLAYSYLHNMSDAEEIVQDTLIQLMECNPVFENKTHEKAWLLRVAGNLSKNRIHYNTLRKTDELNDSLIAEQKEDLSFVWGAVKSLPAKYREVIHLFYYEGYSAVEIAKILQKNEATVRSNLHRGRVMLKEILKEAYDFEETV